MFLITEYADCCVYIFNKIAAPNQKQVFSLFPYSFLNIFTQIFGPVQSIIKFTDMEDVLERANNSSYGLAAGVVTDNINTALMMAQGLEAGSVW